jgi:hypothetical protein
VADGYPAAEGFDLAGSDAKAIEIADAVMEKMGGWDNWDKTRCVTWRFFGRRLHVWDKWTGKLRHEDGDMVIAAVFESPDAVDMMAMKKE